MSKVVVFGKKESIYTKMVVYNLCEKGVNFDLILESPVKNGNKTEKNIFNKLRRTFGAGAFKPLKPFHWFTFFLLFERFKSKSNPEIIRLINKYKGVSLKASAEFSNINDSECAEYLESMKYDYALFAGVGIVKGGIIGLIKNHCLNAHPAPLPECRGGGALECTLYKKIKPSVSVHVATAGIDEGDIFLVKELEMQSNDNFMTITHKLTELCAVELVSVCKRLVDQELISLTPNNGELNFWQDWNFEKQLCARKNLKEMLRNI